MDLPDHHFQDRPGGPVWVEAGKKFEFDDLVFYREKGQVGFADAAGSIDLIITGPHATGALPREVEPFLADGITERDPVRFLRSRHVGPGTEVGRR